MSVSPLIKKLRLQAGHRAAVINAPPGYLEQLGELPEGVEMHDVLHPASDFVHLFVSSRAELERIGPAAIESLKYDGLLWISYPKRSSKVETDLTRDQGWELLGQAGMRPVTQISIDNVWSALRFRPVERVGG